MNSFPYDVKIQDVRLGGETLRLECLQDLNQTIDDLFDHFSQGGSPALLEELCPYFGMLWPSGRVLGEILAEIPRSELENRSLLEVGCGLAAPSLVAARRGARVTATDSHPDIPRFLERNLELNAGCPVKYRCVDWAEVRDPAPIGGPFDWVVASDILYERPFAEQVPEAFKRLAAPGGRVILTDPGRPYLQRFVDGMRERGFAESTSIRRARDEHGDHEIFVVEFTKGAAAFSGIRG